MTTRSNKGHRSVGLCGPGTGWLVLEIGRSVHSDDKTNGLRTPLRRCAPPECFESDVGPCESVAGWDRRVVAQGIDVHEDVSLGADGAEYRRFSAFHSDIEEPEKESSYGFHHVIRFPL